MLELLINLITRFGFERIVREHEGDKWVKNNAKKNFSYCKTFKITIIFSESNSGGIVYECGYRGYPEKR